LKFTGQHPGIDYAALAGEWDVYFFHILIGFDNAFFKEYPRDKDHYFEFVSDGIIPELYLDGRPTIWPTIDDLGDAYPRLNQTKIRFRHLDNSRISDSLLVELSHSMPNFEKFLIRLNGGEWQITQPNFQWVLRKGGNSIEVKAVNLAGIEGKTSKIMLRNNISLIKK
jgi:hypothetical protein